MSYKKAWYLAKVMNRPWQRLGILRLSFLFCLSDSVLQAGHGCFNRALVADPSRGAFGYVNDVLVTLGPGELKAFFPYPVKLARFTLGTDSVGVIHTRAGRSSSRVELGAL